MHLVTVDGNWSFEVDKSVLVSWVPWVSIYISNDEVKVVGKI